VQWGPWSSSIHHLLNYLELKGFEGAPRFLGIAPTDAVWQFVYPNHLKHEIICHNDVAPYNMVYRDGKPQALIDFDTVGPGPGIWDIAYTVYRFVPLSYTQEMQALGLADPKIQAQRLSLFCQAYGLMYTYEEVIDTVVHRLEALCNLLIERSNDAVYQKMIVEGHLDHYRREITSLQHFRNKLEHSLQL
jgi:Phosphotransferase enzyme family